MKKTAVILALLTAAAVAQEPVDLTPPPQQPETKAQKKESEKREKRLAKMRKEQKRRQKNLQTFERCQQLYHTPKSELSTADADILNGYCAGHYILF